MSFAKRIAGWVLVGLGAVSFGVLWLRVKGNAVELQVQEPAPDPPAAEPTFGPVRRLGMLPTSSATAAAVPSVVSTVTLRPTGVACKTAEECRGPRPEAPCIEFRCVGGQCLVDDSTCECRRAEDCEDHEPCTRNHCFVPTMKCIFIRENCD